MEYIAPEYRGRGPKPLISDDECFPDSSEHTVNGDRVRGEAATA